MRVAGVGGIGRLDLLIERPSDSMFRGVTIGLHAAALKASPFNEANRTSEQLVLADGATEPVSQSVTEELDLSSVGSSMVIKAGLMVGARMAF